MTEKVKKLLADLRSGDYKKDRIHATPEEATTRGKSYRYLTSKARIKIEHDGTKLFENDRIGFNRTTDVVQRDISGGNLTPNYGKVINGGLEAIANEVKCSMSKTDNADKIEFGKAMLDAIDLFYHTADKYKIYAKEKGVNDLYEALTNIPRNGARNLYEGVVFFKLITYVLRMGFFSHVTIGRFDQYMYELYKKDKASGKTDKEQLELLEEFFISLNRDTDLYQGAQQGDNGQSMVLGGFDKDGNSMYNELSQLCMEASLELCLIDPKINLRVGKNTPDELYVLGSQLTKAGLGFPQYLNDDIIVPGLVKLGYDYRDALDYTVAACWEPIIPGKGADWPNAHCLDFPKRIRYAVDRINECDTFEKLLEVTGEEISKGIEEGINATCSSVYSEWYVPNAIVSLLFDGCTEKLTDPFSGGVKYRNIGFHGLGISTAADSLAAVKKFVYDEKTISKEQLLDALKNNYEGYEDTRKLLASAPKMGNNDNYVDDIACAIMRMFSDGLNNKKHNTGIYRAGTGTAMEYYRVAAICPATPNGRRNGENYSANYSPAPDSRVAGLLSAVQSFTKYDLSDIVNGGPFTVEIHDTVFRNQDGIEKTAQLVKQFIALGGHEIQLNAVNRDTLLDAKAHPENHKNLIVRVWGWSGYFNELDAPYQDHVINRIEFAY